ncbi:CotD family spore coat protein [Bacillus canaveralius]|uniref:CotD family spore coat protein n=1 Tax=Bacillus canaveralius TaxID=1403243 RepID=UPI000F781B77|nr:CotD family spore coat protein [Bacillus canaveralius]RSK51892.1 spore coat protein CotD [Bacillus canaveralius]
MHCRPHHVLPAIVHPTKCCVKHNFMNNVVPHIHPTHTTTVNHLNYQHQHYFPQTQSFVNDVSNQQFYHPPGSVPPFGPGAVAGAGIGPGPMPGFGPGPGPGAVAGAEYMPGQAQVPPNWRRRR